MTNRSLPRRARKGKTDPRYAVTEKVLTSVQVFRAALDMCQSAGFTKADARAMVQYMWEPAP